MDKKNYFVSVTVIVVRIPPHKNPSSSTVIKGCALLSFLTERGKRVIIECVVHFFSFSYVSCVSIYLCLSLTPPSNSYLLEKGEKPCLSLSPLSRVPVLKQAGSVYCFSSFDF